MRGLERVLGKARDEEALGCPVAARQQIEELVEFVGDRAHRGLAFGFGEAVEPVEDRHGEAVVEAMVLGASSPLR
jgi:hypothetical protein